MPRHPVILDAMLTDEPVYVLPPIEREPEMSIRADMLAEQRDWGHAPLGIPELHGRGIYGEGIVVAVCDTGISANHQDLKANMVPVGNKDFTGSQSGFMDMQSHGSHVAGIVAAGNNEIGMIGVAPKAKLLAVKVLNDQGSGRSSWIAAGIRHAADSGADIINLSLGGPGQDAHTRSAIQYAVEKGCWVACAAGNDSGPADNYPGHYPEPVAVTAVDRDGKRASFSTINRANDIAAPGVSIMSTLPNDRYGSMSGTSMATPYVSGGLALIRGELKRLALPIPSQARLLEAIKQTSRDIPPTGPDSGTGYGLMDIDKLLAYLIQTSPTPPTPPKPPTPPPVPPITPGLFPIGPFDYELGDIGAIRVYLRFGATPGAKEALAEFFDKVLQHAETGDVKPVVEAIEEIVK